MPVICPVCDGIGLCRLGNGGPAAAEVRQRTCRRVPCLQRMGIRAEWIG